MFLLSAIILFTYRSGLLHRMCPLCLPKTLASGLLLLFASGWLLGRPMPLQDVAFSRLGMRVGMLPRGCVIRNGLPMPVAASLPADIIIVGGRRAHPFDVDAVRQSSPFCILRCSLHRRGGHHCVTHRGQNWTCGVASRSQLPSLPHFTVWADSLSAQYSVLGRHKRSVIFVLGDGRASSSVYILPYGGQ